VTWRVVSKPRNCPPADVSAIHGSVTEFQIENMANKLLLFYRKCNTNFHLINCLVLSVFDLLLQYPFITAKPQFNFDTNILAQAGPKV
jgi:hypothetical protein